MDNNFNTYTPQLWHNASFYNNPTSVQNQDELVKSSELSQPLNNNSSMYYIANVPIDLAKSLEGKYFVGMAEDLTFGNATNAWARLHNPPDSGVNLFVNVWTTTDISSTPYRVQIFINSEAPGIVQESSLVTSANTALNPIPKPRTRLEYAVGVRGLPQGGTKAFGRYGQAGTTINSEEYGKFIIPPGGSFMVFLSNPETPTKPAIGKVAFGWWEEPVAL